MAEKYTKGLRAVREPGIPAQSWFCMSVVFSDCLQFLSCSVPMSKIAIQGLSKSCAKQHSG